MRCSIQRLHLMHRYKPTHTHGWVFKFVHQFRWYMAVKPHPSEFGMCRTFLPLMNDQILDKLCAHAHFNCDSVEKKLRLFKRIAASLTYRYLSSVVSSLYCTASTKHYHLQIRILFFFWVSVFLSPLTKFICPDLQPYFPVQYLQRTIK